jgi:uncharacterized membrane protein YgdD (TMEM256/DUF423 family)
MYHGLAILFCELLNSSKVGYSVLFFRIGSLIFSGSLYLLVLLDKKWLGAITPIGGVFLLIGWIILVFSH